MPKPSYKVLDHTFETFAEVMTWAWATYKIEFDPYDENGSTLTEELKQKACQELEITLEQEENLSRIDHPQFLRGKV